MKEKYLRRFGWLENPHLSHVFSKSGRVIMLVDGYAKRANVAVSGPSIDDIWLRFSSRESWQADVDGVHCLCVTLHKAVESGQYHPIQ